MGTNSIDWTKEWESRRGTRPVRIANFSGHSSDRITGLAEVTEWGGSAASKHGGGFLSADFAVGDFLAEATLAYLAKRDVGGTGSTAGGGGYLAGFVKQLQSAFKAIHEKGIRVVTNAGGANPAGLAKAVSDLAIKVLGPEAGGKVKVAWVSGDNIGSELEKWKSTGEAGELRSMDTGIKLAEWDKVPTSANAYLGAFGIVEALERGAQIVVCGRITDASFTLGPAAYWWKWKRTQFDQLAAGILLGHVIEVRGVVALRRMNLVLKAPVSHPHISLQCSCYVTGGNYSGFMTIGANITPAFPMAIVEQDGSAIVTKCSPEHGGDVTVDTVTAQIVYEVQGPYYLNPDATVDLCSPQVEQVTYTWPRMPGQPSDSTSAPAPTTVGVRISGIRGGPPPPTTKVGVNGNAGFACEVSVFAVGLRIPEKFLHFEMQIRELLHRNGNSVEHLYGRPELGPKGPNKIEAIRFECVGYNGPVTSGSTDAIKGGQAPSVYSEEFYSDPLTMNAATAWFRVTATARTREPVSRPRFAAIISGQAIQQGFPGFVCQADGSKFDPVPFIEYFPTVAPQSLIKHTANILNANQGGSTLAASLPATTIPIPPPPSYSAPPQPWPGKEYAGSAKPSDFGPTRRVPLGLVAHGRCGDKGGNSNLGFWPVIQDPAKRKEVYEWLKCLLSTEKCRELLGNEVVEAERITRGEVKVRIVRWEMDNLKSVCFVVKGLLGKVSSIASRCGFCFVSP